MNHWLKTWMLYRGSFHFILRIFASPDLNGYEIHSLLTMSLDWQHEQLAHLSTDDLLRQAFDSKKSFWILAARQNGVPDLIRGDYECSSTFDDILIAWKWIFCCYCCEDKVLFSVDTWKELQVAVSSMTQKTLCWKDDSHISLPSKLLSSSCEEPYGPALIIIWWIKASHLCLKSQLMVVSINYLQMPLAAYQHSWKKTSCTSVTHRTFGWNLLIAIWETNLNEANLNRNMWTHCTYGRDD